MDSFIERSAEFNRRLFAWHRSHYRPMRWRATRDPYRILVSEIMLQQTQVVRVRGKYREFIRRFPTVRALARAPLSDVLSLWFGLGYNRRAKYLRDCAREVVAKYGGKFPRSREVLLSLPGIGPSTASALRAFAFREDDPIIDTNLRRVLQRVFCRSRKVTDRELYTLAQKVMPRGKGREWNYAMLDLAATTCTARNHSDNCPMTTLHGPVYEPWRTARLPFRLTRRFARGRALVAIGSISRGATLSDIRRSIGDSPYDAREIISELVRDGLVTQVGKRYQLSVL